MSEKVQYVDRSTVPAGLQTFLAGLGSQLGEGEEILVHNETKEEGSGRRAWYLGMNYGDGMTYVEQYGDDDWRLGL